MAAPVLKRHETQEQLATDMQQHLLTVRTRKLDDVLARLEVVCPELSWGRLAIVMANCGLFTMNAGATVVGFLSRNDEMAGVNPTVFRVVSWFELCYGLSGVGIMLGRFLPLAWHRENASTGNWRNAARGIEEFKALAMFSTLGLMPRGKYAVQSGPLQLQLEQDHYDETHSGPLQLSSAIPAALGAMGRCVAFSGLEAGMGFLGLAALHVKMGTLGSNPRIPYWMDWLAFANQMNGIVDIDNERFLTVQRVLFAGEDAVFQYGEIESMRDFHGLLARRLVELHGWRRGLLIYLTLDSEDLQRLVIAEDSSARSRRTVHRRIRTGICLGDQWWLAAPRIDMVLTKFLTNFEQLMRLPGRLAK